MISIRRLKRRGNLLLTAIGVAMVLFLLSVALVSMNRQDIQLTLFLDHRLRAQMAARAAANYALQTMRSDEHWEDKQDTFRGRLSDGADWTAQVTPYNDPDGTDDLYEIDGVGTSGFVTNHYRMVVEEFRMVKKPPMDRIPLLFAYTTDGSLAMMHTTFQWTLLGPPPQFGAWLAAHEGPLFTYGPAGSGAGLPSIRKNQSTVSPAETLHEHLVQLEFIDNNATWVDIPDPGPKLGKVYGGTLNGTTASGGQISWYGLVGDALAADQGVVYAHAFHYFWDGSVPTPTPSTPSPAASATRTPPVARAGKIQNGLWAAPALLEYDSTRGSWTVLADYLTVTNPVNPPQLNTTAPLPDFGALGVAVGSVYSLNAANSNQALSAGGNGWSVASLPVGLTEGLINYNGSIVVHQAHGNGIELADSEPDGDLRVVEPELRGDVWDPVDGVFKSRKFRNERDAHVRIFCSAKKPIYINDGTRFAGYKSLEDGGNVMQHFQGDKSVAEGGNQEPDFQGDKSIADGGNTMAPFQGFGPDAGDLGNSPTPIELNPNHDPSYAPGEHPEGQLAVQNVQAVPLSYGGNQVATLGGDLVTFARIMMNGYSPDAGQPNRSTTALVHYDGKHWQVWPGGLHAFTCSTTAEDSLYPLIGNGLMLQTENIAWAEYDGRSPILRRYEPIWIQAGGSN